MVIVSRRVYKNHHFTSESNVIGILFTMERYPILKFVASFMLGFKILPMYIITHW